MIFFPSFGAIILGIFLRAENIESNKNAKLLSLVTTFATFIFSLFVIYNFNSDESGFQLVEEYKWLMGLTYKVGIDGISLPLVILTTVTMPIVIISSWKIENKVKEYMICFLLLETLILGVFCSLDIVLFYLFFESGLIPMFLIIGIWGGNNRVYAAFKFFLYTLLGSILMLFAIIYMWTVSGTTDVPSLMSFNFNNSGFSLFGYSIKGGIQSLLWVAFFASLISTIEKIEDNKLAEDVTVIALDSVNSEDEESLVINQLDKKTNINSLDNNPTNVDQKIITSKIYF